MNFKDKDEKILQTQRAIQLQRKTHLFDNWTAYVKEWKVVAGEITSTYTDEKRTDTVSHIPKTS